MSYTNVWSDTSPTGGEAANTIDDIFRSKTVDIEQRIIDIFAMPSMVTDPLRPYGLKFTAAADSIIYLGDLGGGHARNLIFKDQTGSTTFATINDLSFIVKNRLVLGTDITGETSHVISDGIALNSLDSIATDTKQLFISGSGVGVSGTQIIENTSFNQANSTTGSVYAKHIFAGASHTTGTIGAIHGLGIVGGVNGNGGTTTTFNNLSINFVSGTGAIITNWNGILFFAPSGTGTITNIKAINIGNMGTTNSQFAIITGTGLVQLGDQLILKLGTTARASLRMPPGVAPTSPAEGEFWYDGTNLKFRDSTTSRTITWV